MSDNLFAWKFYNMRDFYDCGAKITLFFLYLTKITPLEQTLDPTQEA